MAWEPLLPIPDGTFGAMAFMGQVLLRRGQGVGGGGFGPLARPHPPFPPIPPGLTPFAARMTFYL